MTRTSQQAPLNDSRLIRFLSCLDVSDVEVSHKHFTERLGELIDLSGSISLSSMLGELPKTVFEPATISEDVIKVEFLRVRKLLVETIIDSFLPGSVSSRIRLPELKVDNSGKMLVAFEPYHRFYAIHQREIGAKVQKLRLYVRGAVSGLSPKLCQLSVLDAALDDMLSIQSRKSFLVVPKLLEKRFKQLLHEHQQIHTGDLDFDDPELWMQAGGWLEKYCGEMQGMLLAELDVRLQPVQGLIEAINNEEEKTL